MWIDITWLIIALLALWKGWQKGLIITLFTALAWILGILGALKLSSVLAMWFRDQFDVQSRYTPVISFIVVFIAIALIVYLVGKALEKVFEVVQLGLINKTLGALLRLLIYTFMFSLFLWLINQAGFISPETKVQSKTYSSLQYIADHGIALCSEYLPAVKSIFEDLRLFFEDLANKMQQTM